MFPNFQKGVFEQSARIDIESWQKQASHSAPPDDDPYQNDLKNPFDVEEYPNSPVSRLGSRYGKANEAMTRAVDRRGSSTRPVPIQTPAFVTATSLLSPAPASSSITGSIDQFFDPAIISSSSHTVGQLASYSPPPSAVHHFQRQTYSRGSIEEPGNIPNISRLQKQQRIPAPADLARSTGYRGSQALVPFRNPMLKSTNNGAPPNNVYGQIPTPSADAAILPSLESAPDPTCSASEPPTVNGIKLVAKSALPGQFRSIFRFPLFNAVQSACFGTVFNSDSNFVLASPTGSGKTVMLELAICRLLHEDKKAFYSTHSQHERWTVRSKIIYLGPTKALCMERQKDWSAKFSSIPGITCAELTGDTEASELQKVRAATIIITTPEKWDTITRHRLDQASTSLVENIKLCLIDEVHTLRDASRGATLEVVITRMKTGTRSNLHNPIRFIALSATIPNPEDIATWLRRDSIRKDLPAEYRVFGEEFRPVKVQKHVVGYKSFSNDHAFLKTLCDKVPSVIQKYGQRKPILVFCTSRKDAEQTALTISNWWKKCPQRDKQWDAPRYHNFLQTELDDLKECTRTGVAYHHAGLSLPDRQAVEAAFIDGSLTVICSTSTLAVGVNLPCHFVILKGTMTYSNGKGLSELLSMDVMQMLGRAGRPQFEKSAIAVIMTKQENVRMYEEMVSGRDIVESCLHENLIEHLNAEIGLKTVTNLATAKDWLSGTYFYVRLRINSDHYKLARVSSNATWGEIDDFLESTARISLSRLKKHNLIRYIKNQREEETESIDEAILQLTAFGRIMSQFYVRLETMVRFLELEPEAGLAKLLSTICMADELNSVRFKASEKSGYRSLNRSPAIRFPVTETFVEENWHKVYLLVQAILAGPNLGDTLEVPNTEPSKGNSRASKSKQPLNKGGKQQTGQLSGPAFHGIFQLDFLNDKRAIFQHINRLSSCLSETMAELGNAAGCRKLIKGGIGSIENLAREEPNKIELLLGRNSPYGLQLIHSAKEFPTLAVSISLSNQSIDQQNKQLAVEGRVEFGITNHTVPVFFRGRLISLCLVLYNNNKEIIVWNRYSVRQVGRLKTVEFSATLSSQVNLLNACVMCDNIAGTIKYAIIRPKIGTSPTFSQLEDDEFSQLDWDWVDEIPASIVSAADKSLTSKQVAYTTAQKSTPKDWSSKEASGFSLRLEESGKKQMRELSLLEDEQGPRKRPKSMFEDKARRSCNHKCKDKEKCLHLCCKTGVGTRQGPENGGGSSGSTNYFKDFRCGPPDSSWLRTNNNSSIAPIVRVGNRQRSSLPAVVGVIDLLDDGDLDHQTIKTEGWKGVNNNNSIELSSRFPKRDLESASQAKQANGYSIGLPNSRPSWKTPGIQPATEHTLDWGPPRYFPSSSTLHDSTLADIDSNKPSQVYSDDWVYFAENAHGDDADYTNASGDTTEPERNSRASNKCPAPSIFVTGRTSSPTPRPSSPPPAGGGGGGGGGTQWRQQQWEGWAGESSPPPRARPTGPKCVKHALNYNMSALNLPFRAPFKRAREEQPLKAGPQGRVTEDAGAAASETSNQGQQQQQRQQQQQQQQLFAHTPGRVQRLPLAFRGTRMEEKSPTGAESKGQKPNWFEQEPGIDATSERTTDGGPHFLERSVIKQTLQRERPQGGIELFSSATSSDKGDTKVVVGPKSEAPTDEAAHDWFMSEFGAFVDLV